MLLNQGKVIILNASVSRLRLETGRWSGRVNAKGKVESHGALDQKVSMGPKHTKEIMQHRHVNIQYMYDYWADPVAVHLLLLALCYNSQAYGMLS